MEPSKSVTWEKVEPNKVDEATRIVITELLTLMSPTQREELLRKLAEEFGYNLDYE